MLSRPAWDDRFLQRIFVVGVLAMILCDIALIWLLF
jgi:hypothetical protein